MKIWTSKYDEVSAWLVDERLENINKKKAEIENKVKLTENKFLQNIQDSEKVKFQQEFANNAKSIETSLSKKRNEKLKRMQKPDLLDVTLANEDEQQNQAPESVKKKRNRRFIPKNKFRRINRKVLQQKRNMDYNFSSLEISDSANSLLNNGLKLCPPRELIQHKSLQIYLEWRERW